MKRYSSETNIGRRAFMQKAAMTAFGGAAALAFNPRIASGAYLTESGGVYISGQGTCTADNGICITRTINPGENIQEAINTVFNEMLAAVYAADLRHPNPDYANYLAAHIAYAVSQGYDVNGVVFLSPGTYSITQPFNEYLWIDLKTRISLAGLGECKLIMQAQTPKTGIIVNWFGDPDQNVLLPNNVIISNMEVKMQKDPSVDGNTSTASGIYFANGANHWNSEF